MSVSRESRLLLWVTSGLWQTICWGGRVWPALRTSIGHVPGRQGPLLTRRRFHWTLKTICLRRQESFLASHCWLRGRALTGTSALRSTLGSSANFDWPWRCETGSENVKTLPLGSRNFRPKAKHKSISAENAPPATFDNVQNGSAFQFGDPYGSWFSGFLIL